ncbi:MAG: helix-turn-helix domain-containing protein [Rhodopirellula sp.]|nr:helix-turn-helix domain-containing protein [Rhodopirellula sp.]
MSVRDQYLTVKQAAARLGIASNTLRAWGASGKIPEYRHPVNNYRLFKPQDVDHILQEIEASISTTRRKPR